jgi:hypothetical protein
MTDDFYRDTYQLGEKEMIAFIQGKSLNFMVPGKFHIEVRPPNHGIILTYAEWQRVKTGMMSSPDFSYAETLQFVDDVEGRKKR